jgi:CubicO group peptidase (beta-lactamase class C family)
MWTNQLPPSMKPFKMGAFTFKTSDFGLGMAIQNKYIPTLSIVGEAGWGGAASTNWWASPNTDTCIVAMTQASGVWVGVFVWGEGCLSCVYTGE